MKILKSLSILILLILLILASCIFTSKYDLKRRNFKVLKKPVTEIKGAPVSLLYDSVRLKKEFGIDDVGNPPKYYNGLLPRYPMAVGYFYNNYKVEGLSSDGGFIRTVKCLIIKVNGKNILLDSRKKLKEYFLPINNRYEALSYLTLISNSFPIYDFKFITVDFRIKKPILNKSFVDSLQDGYIVHLFEHPTFGCLHPYSEITYKIDRVGYYRVLKIEDIFFNTNEDGMCVD